MWCQSKKKKKETSGSLAKGASFSMSSYKQQICDSLHRLNDKHLCSTFLPFPSVWLTVESVTTSEIHFVDHGLLVKKINLEKTKTRLTDVIIRFLSDHLMSLAPWKEALHSSDSALKRTF